MVRSIWRSLIAMMIACSSIVSLGMVARPAVAADDPAAVGFASEQWLVIAQQVAEADAFSDLKLEKQPDSSWIVVVADVTNTGSNGTFTADQLKLGKEIATGLAPTSVVSVTPETAATSAFVYPIADSATLRFVLAYQVADLEADDALLILGNAAAPIGDAVIEKLAIDALAAPAPLAITQATVQNVEAGGVLSVLANGTS